jgi:hypothetical protein
VPTAKNAKADPDYPDRPLYCVEVKKVLVLVSPIRLPQRIFDGL